MGGPIGVGGIDITRHDATDRESHIGSARICPRRARKGQTPIRAACDSARESAIRDTLRREHP